VEPPKPGEEPAPEPEPVVAIVEETTPEEDDPFSGWETVSTPAQEALFDEPVEAIAPPPPEVEREPELLPPPVEAPAPTTAAAGLAPDAATEPVWADVWAPPPPASSPPASQDAPIASPAPPAPAPPPMPMSEPEPEPALSVQRRAGTIESTDRGGRGDLVEPEVVEHRERRAKRPPDDDRRVESALTLAVLAVVVGVVVAVIVALSVLVVALAIRRAVG
jgi:hypothetical protein